MCRGSNSGLSGQLRAGDIAGRDEHLGLGAARHKWNRYHSNGGTGFSGVFDGLGNTISNLTVDIGSNEMPVCSAIREERSAMSVWLAALTSGAMSSVGELVGQNNVWQHIADSYANPALSAGGSVSAGW